MNNKTQLIKTIDLNKHTDRDYWAKNQEERIQNILTREFYHNKEYEINNEIPRINVKELSILGYKNPKKAIENLVNRGVVKQTGDIIELVTKQVYCHSCRNYPIFEWDKVNHMETSHHWDNRTKLHNVMALEFSNKPFPDKIDHEYERIGEIEDNKLEVKCRNCGYQRTIYIDYRNECDPYDKGVYIENPEDQADIKVRVGRNSDYIILPNQEELEKFIESKIKENE